MPKFTALTAMLDQLESADAIFQTKIAKTYDEKVIAAAAAVFNKVLAQAADAIIKDINDATLAKTYIELWKPKSAVDTWFGPHPMKFIQHVLTSGELHIGLLPDQSAIH